LFCGRAAINQGGATVSFGYDADNRRTSLTLPNGVVAQYSYDAASQLSGIVYQGGPLSFSNLQYTYDLAGRRTSVSGTLASTQLPAAVPNAVYNANNQLVQWGAAVMTYDLNGNTLSDGMNTYVWDARNRLVSADNDGAAFTYDALWRRIGKTVSSASTNFLFDGVSPVQEQSGGSATANLLTDGVDEHFTRTDATGTSTFLSDAIGSTIALTDSTGNSQVQYSYSPYGSINTTGTTNNSYTYTGREMDGLGIYYYRARYYNPMIGRFLSEDPMGFAGSGTNLYAYAGDDPVDFNDPMGLDKGPNNAPNNQPPQCTAYQQVAAQLANILDNASEQADWLAAGSFLGTVLSGVGEGVTFGADTPVTVTFGTATTFFGTVSTVTGAGGAALKSYASGNTSALQNFNWSNLTNIVTAAAASKIPYLDKWADLIGDLAEQAADLALKSEEACSQ
jgi:RHS repeat-associated protein